MKTIFVLAVGMADGLGLGMNSMSSLITSGYHEMTRYNITLTQTLTLP
jgi:glycerol-3-phosphate dehydrogenase